MPSKIRIAYAHGIDVCMPWEMIEVDDWSQFADWLMTAGTISIIYWEYVPQYSEGDYA